METGAIPLADLPGGIDLGVTLESGQTYCWRREDGRTYEGGVDQVEGPGGEPPWYHTVVDGEVIRVRQTETALEWAATTDAVPYLEDLLRLEDDLDAIWADAPEGDLFDAAFEAGRGMRIVRDPPFACTISFICSAQMRVERIHRMVTAMAETYGETVEAGGETYHAFPSPETLGAQSEDALRDLSLGYRAPYVTRTAEMVAAGEADPADARDLPYEDAREYLTQFVGVGEKVADCVLLFSLGHLEAVPLDTWIRTAISEHFPECDRGNYADTSAAIREQFGGEYAGYVQTYVFHYLRTR